MRTEVLDAVKKAALMTALWYYEVPVAVWPDDLRRERAIVKIKLQPFFFGRTKPNAEIGSA